MQISKANYDLIVYCCYPAFSLLENLFITKKLYMCNKNKYLSESQIKEIESNRDNAEWWRVYGIPDYTSEELKEFDRKCDELNRYTISQLSTNEIQNMISRLNNKDSSIYRMLLAEISSRK